MTSEKTKASKVTKASIARHLCMGTRTVRRLQEEQKLPRDGTLDDFREAHIKHLREQAAGRAAQHGDLDLVEQRALLAQKQREHIELQIAIKRSEHVPIAEATRQINLAGQILLEHIRTLGVRCAPVLAGLVDLPPGKEATITAAMQSVVDKHTNDAMADFERTNESGRLAKMLAPENPEEAPKND